MEWVTTLFVILAIVLLVGGFLAALGVRGPGRNLLWFFIVLFLSTWAIGVWAQPIGPRAWGVPWVSFLIAAVFVGLLIAAVSHHAHAAPGEARRPDQPSLREAPATTSEMDEEREGTEEAAAVATVLNLFFWAFLLVALALLAVRVFIDPAPV